MRRWQSFLAVGLLLLAAPASGSTFLHMSRAELSKQAVAVVVGEVLEVSSFWTKSGQIIVTEAMVEVEDTLLGGSASVVVVRTFGGTVNGYTVEAHGFPTFAKGERVLLFLENDRTERDTHRVLGFQEGKYLVSTNQAGAEIAVPHVDGGARLLGKDGRPAPPLRAIPLADLRDEIRDHARQAGRPVN
jgi:hypothetical protein